jgi:lipopolysaccharide export LptBFGC system permease protein LptF
VDRTPLLWVITLFFGTYLLFALLRRLTHSSPTGVTIAVQLGALVLVLAAIVVYVRRRR